MMQYDKEFHLYLDSWDVYRKMSVERNKEKERVEHIASNCFLIEQIVDTGSNTQRSHV